MYSKESIVSNSDLQLQVIRHYYPQADPSGKFFAIRKERTPSSKLRLYRGVWYLKDFGDGKKAQDCFNVVKDREACDFDEALKIISNKFPDNVADDQLLKQGVNGYNNIKKQLNAIVKNLEEKAADYLRRRKIEVERLPNDAYYYDSLMDAVVFTDSEQKILNRRLINPKQGESKARMTKYTGFDPIYDVLHDASQNQVFITEGVIDSLSLFKQSSISIFTTSNLIKNPEKLEPFIQNKKVVIAFDADQAGDNCADYYSALIQQHEIKTDSLSRLILPSGKDINDLLMDGVLKDFLKDDNNFKIIQPKTEDGSERPDDDKKGDNVASNLTKNQKIEEFLSKRYVVRYNIIKQQPEYKKQNHDGNYLPVDKYLLNSLRRELNKNELSTSVQNIKSILESDYAMVVHPLQDYFFNLPDWDHKTDHIKMLAETVTVENHEIWNEYLKKWLVAVVANIIKEDGCQNHTCLVITGKQGAFKTTWLDNLCPNRLKQYLFTGKIDPQNKDSLTYIAEYLLINIDDQLRQLNKRDENELKNLITTPSVKYRRPYDIYITEYPHTASFMASVNGNDFLTDPTGSRRFLPFEAIEIDIKAAQLINMDLVYSQAYTIFKDGFKYWFDHDEIEALHQHNKAFQVVSNEEQLVLEYFDKPDSRGGATDYMQSAVIQSYIEGLAHTRLSSKKLGEALTKLKFEKWQRTVEGKTKWVWSVIKKPQMEIENENNNNPY